jgi:hypothetical protein
VTERNGDDPTLKATATVDRAKVVRVYSGRPGCACGCRGNYSENPATIARIVNRINALGAQTYDGSEQEFAFADNDEGTRTYTAYYAGSLAAS